MSLAEMESRARELGADAAKAAASWIIDGNHPSGHYERVLALMDDGDPRAGEYLPHRPDLSGEWASSRSIPGLLDEIGFEGDPDADGYGADVQALCDAYEEGVSETFEHECERLLREAVS